MKLSVNDASVNQEQTRGWSARLDACLSIKASTLESGSTGRELRSSHACALTGVLSDNGADALSLPGIDVTLYKADVDKPKSFRRL